MPTPAHTELTVLCDVQLQKQQERETPTVYLDDTDEEQENVATGAITNLRLLHEVAPYLGSDSHRAELVNMLLQIPEKDEGRVFSSTTLISAYDDLPFLSKLHNTNGVPTEFDLGLVHVKEVREKKAITIAQLIKQYFGYTVTKGEKWEPFMQEKQQGWE